MRKFESFLDELKYLSEKNNGKITPHMVVSFAKNPRSHLHSKFEWDNEKAGDEYRLWQARKIIALNFNIIKSENKEIGPVRLFVSLKDDRNKEGGYRLITDVVNDESLRMKLLDEALAELIRIKTKYKMLNELAGVFKAIEKVQELVFETVN